MHKATDHFDNDHAEDFPDSSRLKLACEVAKISDDDSVDSGSSSADIVATEPASSPNSDTAKTGSGTSADPASDFQKTSNQNSGSARRRPPQSGAKPAAVPPENIRFARFARRFLKDCRGRWKPATLKTHRDQIRRQLVPVFGELPVAEITKADVTRWYEDPAHQCPRALSILSSIMQHAEQVGLRQHRSNPCLGLRRKRSDFQAYYPTLDEYLRLGQALEKARATDPVLAAMVLFLALTGARRGEALHACWRHLNEQRLVLPDSKSGPKVIWLSTQARALIDQLPKTPRQRYLFGNCPRQTLSSRLTNFWHRLRSEQQLPKMRLHDFRHGFASRAVNLGVEIRTIGRLLGHADFASTLGYAHLDEAPLKEASERVGRLLGGRDATKVEADQVDAPRLTNPMPTPSRGRRYDH